MLTGNVRVVSTVLHPSVTAAWTIFSLRLMEVFALLFVRGFLRAGGAISPPDAILFAGAARYGACGWDGRVETDCNESNMP